MQSFRVDLQRCLGTQTWISAWALRWTGARFLSYSKLLYSPYLRLTTYTPTSPAHKLGWAEHAMLRKRRGNLKTWIFGDKNSALVSFVAGQNFLFNIFITICPIHFNPCTQLKQKWNNADRILMKKSNSYPMAAHGQKQPLLPFQQFLLVVTFIFVTMLMLHSSWFLHFKP